VFKIVRSLNYELDHHSVLEKCEPVQFII